MRIQDRVLGFHQRFYAGFKLNALRIGQHFFDHGRRFNGGFNGDGKVSSHSANIKIDRVKV